MNYHIFHQQAPKNYDLKGMTWNDGSAFDDKLVAWQTHTGTLITNENGFSFEKEINEDTISVGVHEDVKMVPLCQNYTSSGKKLTMNRILGIFEFSNK